MPRKLFCVGQFCKKPNGALLQATICGKTLAMATPSEIADAIGRKKLAEALEVGRTAIGNAVDRGTFLPHGISSSRLLPTRLVWSARPLHSQCANIVVHKMWTALIFSRAVSRQATTPTRCPKRREGATTGETNGNLCPSGQNHRHVQQDRSAREERASDAGEDREEIGSLIEFTGLHKKAVSFVRMLHKQEDDKRADILRSLHPFWEMMEAYWDGQKTPDMFADAVEPAGEEPIDEPADDNGEPGDEDLGPKLTTSTPIWRRCLGICLAFDIASKTGVAMAAP